MPVPRRPATDSARAAAVRSLGLLDTPPEEEFDALTAAAALICGTPLSYITLIEEERAWFKSVSGNADKRSNARDRSMCSHTILESSLVEVADASQDARFADNPSVLGPPGIRFYASVPLVLSDGHTVGTLCVVDFHPRQLTEAQREVLRWLSRGAIAGMETRRAWHAAEVANTKLTELSLRLEAEVEIRTRERDTLWNVSTDMFGVAGRDGRWRSINPAWSTVLGWSRDDLVDRTSQWLDHPSEPSGLHHFMVGIDSQGAHGPRTARMRTANGDYRWLSWMVVLQGEELYAIARDVTSEHERTTALAEADAVLRQAQKMEALGNMTGGLAHDFNNLLATIKNCLELIGRPSLVQAPEESARLTSLALRSVDRGVTLTQRLLAFARKQPLKFEVVDVNALLLGMEDLLARLLGKHISVCIRIQPGLYPSYLDANQLESSIVNLAINARDAVGSNGTLTIETSSLQVGQTGLVGALDLSAGDYVVLSVSDDGTGMSPEILARAFEPFFSSKTLSKASGLGLAMVHGFAQQSGGTATIFSEQGVGTTVKLFLPRAPSDVASAPPAAAEVTRPSHSGEGVRVLLVEDEADLRLVVAELLRAHGFQVDDAGTAEAGAAAWMAKGDYDVLVSDIRLPGMSGRQLAERLRSNDPAVPVLLMTGFDSQAASPLDRLDDRTALMTKPFAMEQFISEVHRLAGLNNRRVAHG